MYSAYAFQTSKVALLLFIGKYAVAEAFLK